MFVCLCVCMAGCVCETCIIYTIAHTYMYVCDSYTHVWLVYIHVHAGIKHVSAHKYVCIHLCVHTYMYVVCACLCMQECVYEKCRCMLVQVCVCVCVCVCVRGKMTVAITFSIYSHNCQNI